VLNPAGLEGVLRPLETALDPRWEIFRRTNFEWQPTWGPEFRGSWAAWLFFAWAGISAVVLAWDAVRRGPAIEHGLFGLFVYLGLSANRFIPLAGMTYGVLLVSCLSARDMRAGSTQAGLGRRDTCALSGLIVLLLVGIGWVSVNGSKTSSILRHVGVGLDVRLHPIKAAAFVVESGLQGNIFNDQAFGGYLAWQWGTRRKIYMHGFVEDIDFYQDQYHGISRSRREFDELVARHDIKAFFLSRLYIRPGEVPLAVRILLERPEWHLVYLDEVAFIFVREGEGNRRVIERFGMRKG
jgi:hypothetical protein